MLDFSEDAVEQVIDGTRPRSAPAASSGLLFQLKKLPFLIELYGKLQEIKLPASDEAPDNVPETDSSAAYIERISPLLKKMTDDAAGIPVIIFYHEAFELNSDGSAYFSFPEKKDAFAALCAQYGITFVDMTDTFLQAYEQEHILPYGFANTHVEQGHLNQYGHRMIAEKLYDVLCELEAAA